MRMERAIRKALRFRPTQEQTWVGVRYNHVKKRFVFAVAIGLAVVGFVLADDNVRSVQQQLRDGGFYTGEIDGAYSSELSAALTRYQVRKGLPITGQLDTETAEALDAKPAVGPSTEGTEQGSETWRRLRNGERRTSSSARRSETTATEPQEMSSASADQPSHKATASREATADRSPAATARTSSETTEEAPPTTARTSTQDEEAAPSLSANQPSARSRGTTASRETTVDRTPPDTDLANGSSAANISTDRLRDYVGAFVLAGLDPRVGAEADFFADRVQYYDQGFMSREQIREDLKRYAAHWPERRFWIAGDITITPQNGNRVRVTFPLRYELRNGDHHLAGKIDKTLVLEVVGDDEQIVAVNEGKTE